MSLGTLAVDDDLVSLKIRKGLADLHRRNIDSSQLSRTSQEHTTKRNEKKLRSVRWRIVREAMKRKWSCTSGDQKDETKKEGNGYQISQKKKRRLKKTNTILNNEHQYLTSS
jgi:hypothetical protein